MSQSLEGISDEGTAAMPTIVVGEDEATIQDAIDAMASMSPPPTAGNRGTIIVPPGRYVERVSDHVSHVDVVAEIPGTALVEYEQIDSGGTYRIGVDSKNEVAEVRDKVVSGLRIVRDEAGTGQRPEAAFYVGWPDVDMLPVEGAWDNIIIRDCIVEGIHDAIQYSSLVLDPEVPPGLLTIQNCIIRCVHDAVTVKGDARVISKGNFIHVDTRGIDPYLTEITPWKSTGFHMNRHFGGTNPHSYFLSSHDTMYLIGGDNVIAGTGAQAHMAGYLFYDLQFPGDQVVLHRTEIIEPDIYLEWNHDGGPSDRVAGISVWSKHIEIPRDYLTVVGGSITVRQTSTGSSAPGVVYGVRVDAEGASDEIDNIVRVLGTNIRVENLKQGGEAYSLATIGPHDKIEADVYTDEPISGPTGTITPADHQP